MKLKTRAWYLEQIHVALVLKEALVQETEGLNIKLP